MKRFCLTFLISIVLTASGNGNAWCAETTQETVIRPAEQTALDSVAVLGISPSETADLMPKLLSQSGGILNSGLIAHDRDTISSFLQEGGLWNSHVEADIDTTSDGRSLLTFTITAGPRVVLGQVTTHIKESAGDAVPLPDLPPSGETLTGDAIESMFSAVMKAYTAYGYPGITLHPSLTARDDTVDVHLEIHPGARATVDSVVVTGLTNTRPHIVRRELRHLLGRDAGPAVVTAAKTGIERLSIVRSNQDPYLSYTDDGACLLVLGLAEGSQGSFEGVLGYQPDSTGESGEVVGKIDLTFPNIMGTGRSAHIMWENLGEDSEDLQLTYREPWIFGIPYAVYGSFMQEQREQAGYTKTTMRSGLDRNISRLRARLGFRYEKVSADSSDSASAYGADMEVEWNGLDNAFLPRSGIQYSVLWTGLTKKYRFVPESDHRFDRLALDLDHYVPTFESHTLAILLRYRQVNIPDEKLTLSDRYWVGGASSIRGYREEIFPAVEAFWMNLEYRLLQGRGSWFFVFADSGYMKNVTEKTTGGFETSELIRTGYGFGLRLQSPAGQLGFDYGLGKGDGISEGKLHVRLLSSF